jgi:hypothetical protein
MPIGQSVSIAQPHDEIAGSEDAMHFGPNALDAQSVAAEHPQTFCVAPAAQ